MAEQVSSCFQVPYIPYFSMQFSAAYNVYLDICQHVSHQIKTALRFHTPILHLKQACPCCFSKQEDQPELEFLCLVSIDGNNLLKCLGATIRQTNNCLDSCAIVSDHWLTNEEVNRLKDEVKSQVKITNNIHLLLC
jgi:hypothetical protein